MSKPENIGTSALMTIRSLIGPFEVRSPPIKKHKVAGHLVPTLQTTTRFFNVKRRRITIEILSPLSIGKAAPSSNDHHDSPHTGTLLRGDLENEVLNDHDKVVFRIFRLARKKEQGAESNGSHDLDDNDGDFSVSTMGSSTNGDDSGAGWREHRNFNLDDVELLKLTSKTLEVKLGAGNETIVRDLRFASTQEAATFRDAVTKLKTLESERAARQVAKYRAASLSIDGGPAKKKPTKAAGDELSSPLNADETIAENDDEEDDDERVNLLVEIVSARDLPVADITSTDAYIVVRMKGKEIHRTGVVGKNLSPIWTVENGSLFLLQMSPEEFFSSQSGMTFVLKDFDSFGSNDLLGSVTVPLEVLLAGKGERMCFEIVLDNAITGTQASDNKGMLDLLSTKTSAKTGMLNLRFKKATKDDIEFMNACRGRSKEFGLYADETFVPIRRQNAKFLQRQEKKGPNKEVLYRVRPGPDPERPEDSTTWMTSDQIRAEALKPSTRWIAVGTGGIGKLYLEVIACDKLPNMDTITLNPRDKTDAFACIVYEDCIVNTDVIVDSLSPRWMPWCQRAFAFNISHPSSDVFLGLFDHDLELNPLHLISSTVHDPIGRLVINVCNFKPGTSYLLTYPLYVGELEEQRKYSRGTVTLRLRLEFPDMRAALIRGMLPPPQTTVSVARSVDYEVAHYTTDGLVDEDKFSLNTLTRYIEEVQTLSDVMLQQMRKAAMSVWLWRGHFPIKVAGKSYKLPLHSVTAFSWGMLVTWNWNRLPACCVFCVGWLLLAANEHVRKHPSRWHQCPSYSELCYRIILNTATSESVSDNANLDEIIEYDKRIEQLQQRRVMEKLKEQEQELTLQRDLGQEIEAAKAAEKLGGNDGGIFSGLVKNPLMPVLYPIQQQLSQFVYSIRIAKSVVLWHEAFYSFWIVTGCFLLSAVFFWLPWGFLLRWLLRIIVFIGLGPWMAIVDRKYFKTNPDKDEELRHRLRARYDEVLLSATNYFQRKERAMKLLSMKKLMFGKHTLRVPRFCEDRYEDLPLPSSSCDPVDPDLSSLRVDQVKFCQNLKGDMIPKREIQVAVADMKKLSGKKTNWKSLQNLQAISPEKIPLLGYASDERVSCGYSSVATLKKTD